MAEIDVQRKGASIWPWILGLLVAALLIWALMSLFDGGDEVQLVEPASEVGLNPQSAPPPATRSSPSGATP